MRNPSHFRFFRFLAYTLEIIVLFILQQTPGLIPDFWGIRPTLLIPVALSIAMYEKETVSMAFGVLCGLLIDFGGGGSAYGFHAILLAMACYAASMMVSNLFKTNLLTALLMGLCAMVAVYLFQWLFFYVFYGYGHPGYALVRHYLPRVAYTMIFMPLAYYFNRAFAILLREQT